jgi:outer membrane protein assembly factor BamB
VDANSGELLKQNAMPSSMNASGSPAIDGEDIYYPSAEKGVIALKRETLELKCIYPSGATLLFTAPYVRGDAQMVEASPIVLGNLIVFTASDGYLYVYDKNTAELVKKICLGAPSLVKPAIDGNAVYVGDFDGKISKLTL